MPTPSVCERARQARDARFDGRFFVGVLTTGIYCRPVCPARTPLAENVRFFPSNAAAQSAGFRPCLRCKPDLAAPPASHRGGAVGMALRHIEAGCLNDGTTAGLAARLGIGARQLNRLFQAELGTTPLAVARAVRLQTARRLLRGTHLKISDVAMHAGYGSLRRFNDEFRRVYGRAPGEMRGEVVGASTHAELHLPLRQPFNASWLLDFLAARALPPIETVVDGAYRRQVPLLAGGVGVVQARPEADRLHVRIPVDCAEPMHVVLRRLRRIFDLEADGAAIDAHLRLDPWLAPWVEQAPGLRVPGAWGGFETAVRAILGQQVSVARARTIAQRFVDDIGGGVFPSPARLADCDIAALGAMPSARCDAVRALSRQVAAGTLVIDECQDSAQLQAALMAIPGIGPWTAQYIAMRIGRDPDVFLPGDWVVKQALADAPAGPHTQPDAWQPWRAYAVMVLWQKAAAQKNGIKQQ
ncbi:MAG: Ada metal-binding domain-containing protein [Pseudomonadales bacterium]